jgi:hypothetical protein
LTTTCACYLSESFAKELFFLCNFLYWFWVWVTCIELVPSSESLSIDDVFCACEVFDLTVRCFFSVEFVPMFETCTLVSDEFDWFEFLIFFSCFDVD